MHTKIISLTIFYILSIVTTYAQDITIGSKHTLHSNILNEERAYWVHLPDNYSADKEYPVAYVTDGAFQFYSISGIINFHYRVRNIPEMIVVGIPNTNRIRDLTPTNNTINSYGVETPYDKDSGGADNFLKFIMTELSPTIEKQYSVNDYRMLIGHSHGGLFAIHSFLKAPDFFNSFISIDPSLYWDDEIIKKRLVEKLSNQPNLNNSIYISAANNIGDSFLSEEVMFSAQKEFVKTLSNSDKVKMKFERFDDENHLSVHFVSVAHGLLFIFDNFTYEQ